MPRKWIGALTIVSLSRPAYTYDAYIRSKRHQKYAANVKLLS